MPYSSAELTALSAHTVHIGIFFRLEVTPILRLWGGVGEVEPGVNALDSTGVSYLGFGTLGNIPAVQQLINGQASRVQFSLSGINDAILALANSSDAVKGQNCALGVGIMNGDWSQLLGEVHWLWRGISDFIAMQLSGEAGGQLVKTATLSVGSQMTGRRRRGLSYWTDQDQQQRSPGDQGCERVTLYAQGVTKTWPRF